MYCGCLCVVPRLLSTLLFIIFMSLQDIATSALSFACRHLSTNGNFLCKISRGGTEKAFVEEVKQHFDTVLLLKPEASRKTSPELYVYGYKYGGSG